MSTQGPEFGGRSGGGDVPASRLEGSTPEITTETHGVVLRSSDKIIELYPDKQRSQRWVRPLEISLTLIAAAGLFAVAIKMNQDVQAVDDAKFAASKATATAEAVEAAAISPRATEFTATPTAQPTPKPTATLMPTLEPSPTPDKAEQLYKELDRALSGGQMREVAPNPQPKMDVVSPVADANPRNLRVVKSELAKGRSYLNYWGTPDGKPRKVVAMVRGKVSYSTGTMPSGKMFNFVNVAAENGINFTYAFEGPTMKDSLQDQIVEKEQQIGISYGPLPYPEDAVKKVGVPAEWVSVYVSQVGGDGSKQYLNAKDYTPKEEPSK